MHMSQEEERLKGLFLSLRAYDADTYLDFVHYALLQPRTDPQATTPKEKEALLVTIPDRNDKNNWLIKYVRSDPRGFRSNPKEQQLQTDLEFAKLRQAAAQQALKSYLDKRDAAPAVGQEALKEQIARQNKVIADLKVELNQKTVTENSETLRKSKEWDRRLNQLTADAKAKDEEIRRLHEQNADLRAEVKKFKSPDMLADEIQQQNRIKMQEQRLRDQLKTLGDENASLKKTIVDLEFKARDVRGAVDLNKKQMEFDVQLAQAMQGMESLKLRTEKAEERVAAAQRERDELYQQLEALKKSGDNKLPGVEAELQAKLDIMTQTKEAKETQIAQLQNALEAMEQKHLKQAMDTVHAVMRFKWQSQLYLCVWKKLIDSPNVPFTVQTLVELELMAAADRSSMSVEGVKARSKYYTDEKKTAPPQPNS